MQQNFTASPHYDEYGDPPTTAPENCKLLGLIWDGGVFVLHGGVYLANTAGVLQDIIFLQSKWSTPVCAVPHKMWINSVCFFSFSCLLELWEDISCY